MADSVLYLIRAVPGQGCRWQEAVEMALTSAIFGMATTVWLSAPPLARLSRRADASQLLAELTDLGVRCVAAQDELPTTMTGVEALRDDELAALRRDHKLMVVL